MSGLNINVLLDLNVTIFHIGYFSVLKNTFFAHFNNLFLVPQLLLLLVEINLS